MAEKTDRREPWRRLYRLAREVKQLAPWDWMAESDLFGVQIPESGRTVFVGVTGSEGIHYAVAAYPDLGLLHRFRMLDDIEREFYPERLLEIPQLQLSFDDRADLADHAYRTIRRLGLRFRGKNAWPQFQSFRPGHLPGVLQEGEPEVMAHVLEQLLNLAPRMRTDPEGLAATEPDTFLVRVPTGGGSGGGVFWRDEFRRFSAQVPDIPEPPLRVDLISRLKKLPEAEFPVEVDLFMTPAVVDDREHPPVFGYALLVVNGDNGIIIGTEMLVPQPTLDAMYQTVPSTLAAQLIGAGFRPREMVLRSDLLLELLPGTAHSLGCSVREVEVFAYLDEAREGLLEFLTR